MALALPPDGGDFEDYFWAELEVRWPALDKFFNLDSAASDIWQRRVAALIAYETGMDSPGRISWQSLTFLLAMRSMPGFRIKQSDANKHGHPLFWTNTRLAELFADIENLKRKQRKSVREIIKALPKMRRYASRWGQEKPAGLRKAYTKANKRRQTDLIFQIELSGPAALIPSNRIDPIQAAIDLHALEKS